MIVNLISQFGLFVGQNKKSGDVAVGNCGCHFSLFSVIFSACGVRLLGNNVRKIMLNVDL